MDLTLLRSFVAVAEAGTITAAAERVHLSQSALSRRLQQLEADLGAELVVRGRHGIELTELGRQSLEAARVVVARYDRLVDDIGGHLRLEAGTVRIGAGATVTSYVLPGCIAAFGAEYPGIRFYVKEAGSREVAADVAAGTVELGVVTLPVPTRELEVRPLAEDQIVLVARPEHPFATGRIGVGDLEGQPFVAFESGSAIRQIIDGALRSAGVDIDIVMELRSIPSILRMVATTGHLAFVSRVSLAGEASLRGVGVRGLSISRTLGLVTRAGMGLSAPAGAFAATLPRGRLGPGR